MRLLISASTELKLRTKHNVNKEEIAQCFENRTENPVIDFRVQHTTDPPTQWFISPTDTGRRLKIVFMQISATAVVVKTAYKPNVKEEKVYRSRLKKVKVKNQWLI